MNYYDERYSAYFAAPDANYPLGSAVDSTSEDNLDGTPYLAAFFNDVIGSMQAVIFGVFGKDYKVSGSPDSCGKSDVWDAIKKFVNDGDDALAADIAAINAKIPAQASTTNQLADKDFVNSSIATNTAYFVGTFDSVAALNAYSGTKTNNDYAFVQSKDSAGNTIFSRYKWNGTAWLYEYELNNSSFTAAQWAAINSGATSTLIGLIQPMGGASASADGSGGFVPQPKAGDQTKVLRGDGTWMDISGNIGLQAAFNAAHPVGSTYTQFPQQDPPETVFNKNGVTSTWSVLDYGGAFFRAQGGQAETFKSVSDVLTLQPGQNLSHNHGERINEDNGDNAQGESQHTVPLILAVTRTGTANTGFLGNSVQGVWIEDPKRNQRNLQIKTDYEGGNEARPANYTIRIWKRTA
ncbi:MAG: hypothetical protein HDR37_03905 [Treponema sp.]|nr:hypothetical protein [Treponema sp.]